MSDKFIARLNDDVGLTETERQVLQAVDVRSYEDLQSLVEAFPSIARTGVELPKLSNAAFPRVAESWVSFSQKAEREIQRVSFGALPPFEASVTPGAVVGMPGSRRTTPATAPGQTSIDLRLANWPVRNQDQRGTCVSFGTVACVEHALGGRFTDMSEQFLYWAMKTHTNDPYPNQDGSWLEFSLAALASHGVCTEAEWPYVGSAVQPVSGAAPGRPTASALSSATAHRSSAALHQRNPRKATATIVNALAEGSPVAICLPVFSDPLTPRGQTNWTTGVGWAFGHVINPPPTSKVSGGHCVCIVGYSPDEDEPTGGYFVIRNSWSEDWGSQNPDSESHAPAPGYGFVSGTYINTYAWEIMRL